MKYTMVGAAAAERRLSAVFCLCDAAAQPSSEALRAAVDVYLA